MRTHLLNAYPRSIQPRFSAEQWHKSWTNFIRQTIQRVLLPITIELLLLIVAFCLLKAFPKFAAAEVSERCDCHETLQIGDKAHRDGCRVISDCKIGWQQPDRALTLVDPTIAFKPKGKGFRITWSANLSEDPTATGALFALERRFEASDSCLLVVLNISEKRLPNKMATARIIDFECNYSKPHSGVQYSMTLLSLPRSLPMGRTNSFTGRVFVPGENTEESSGLWTTTTFIRSERANCSENSNIFLSFTLPENEVYTSYDVILCRDSRCNSHYRRTQTSQNEITFNDVIPGDYYTWIAPVTPSEDAGNSASKDSFTVSLNPVPIWDAGLGVQSRCPTDAETCCMDVRYQPSSPELRYKKYTIHLRNRTIEKVQHIAEDEDHNSGKSVTFCGLTPGLYDVEVSASGECPAWEKTYKVDVSLDVHIKPAEEIWRIVGGVFAAVIIAAVVIAAKCRHRNGFSGLCSRLRTSVALNWGREKRAADAVSDSEGAVFGGPMTAVLVLYARDHECHVSLIKSFAEILRKYGGFDVNIDQWCEMDAVQRSDWLGRQVAAASAVIVFSSDGARVLHEAFLANQTYRKYANAFPASFQISEVLALAEKLPALRRKLVKVSAEYSTTGLNTSAWSMPEFVIPAELPQLVCYLHGATRDSEWSCTQQYLQSRQLKSMLHHVKKMSHLLMQTPNFFERTFGPAEDRLDSGIDQLSSRLWQEGSFDASSGCTDVYTLHSPDPPHQTDEGCKWSTAHQKRYDLPRLNTEMPKIEELWRAHAMSDSSPVSAELMSADRFKLALMRMTSVPSSNSWSAGGGSNAATSNAPDPLLDIGSCRTISVSDANVLEGVEI